jgi:hypothetical protein
MSILQPTDCGRFSIIAAKPAFFMSCGGEFAAICLPLHECNTLAISLLRHVWHGLSAGQLNAFLALFPLFFACGATNKECLNTLMPPLSRKAPRVIHRRRG